MDKQAQLFPPSLEEAGPRIKQQRAWLRALRTYEPQKRLEQSLPGGKNYSGALYERTS